MSVSRENFGGCELEIIDPPGAGIEKLIPGALVGLVGLATQNGLLDNEGNLTAAFLKSLRNGVGRRVTGEVVQSKYPGRS